MSKFDSEVRAPAFAFKEATRTTPEYLGKTLIIVPLAAGVGLVVLIGWWFICLGLGWTKTDALFWAGLTMIACVLFSFYRVWKDELYNAVEEIFGHDLDGDGYIGAPPKQITHYELNRGGNNFRVGEIEVEPQLLIDWCTAAYHRRSTAYELWEHRFALPDGTQGRKRYQQFRDHLVKEKFAKEVGGSVGLKIAWGNPEAVQFIGGFADMDVSQGTPLLDA